MFLRSNRMSQIQSAENRQQPLRKTHVVTSFLLRTDTAQPRILIVRRSQRVGSYNERWAGISGFVETGVTPDEQAFTEIREETGLQREQLRLPRRPAVEQHDDAPSNRP